MRMKQIAGIKRNDIRKERERERDNGRGVEIRTCTKSEGGKGMQGRGNEICCAGLPKVERKSVGTE
jgi:hypothetical protein